MDTSAFDDALPIFVSVRPRLLGIAYRMLGSAAEAEDIVHDGWLRWQAADRSVVLDTPAFLATTTRLAINFAQSARSRRETYIGPWLPEPVDTSADPALGAERGEAAELAVLLLLEKLTPKERGGPTAWERGGREREGAEGVDVDDAPRDTRMACSSPARSPRT